MATADNQHHKAHIPGANLGGTHVKQYDNLKTLLKNAKSTSGQDLFTHLQGVFKELIMHYPDQALDKLEEVSYLLKHEGDNGLKLKDFLVVEEQKDYTDLAVSQQQYIDKLLTFFKKPPAENEEEEGGDGGAAAEEPPAATGYVSDLTTDTKVFEWAGIGFGEVESYRIMKSMKKLAIDSGAQNIRFFGKVTGTLADYYVAEGALDGGDEDNGDVERPADFEPRGIGVNKFVYWVTTNILNETWTKLPDLLPKDIVAARQIKVLFTGDLDRPIYTNPYFFGQEKHYLRAQIARIVQSTTLVPAGLYKITEDNDKEIEEFVPDEGAVKLPSTHDMAKAENWVHYNQSILQVGRTAHIQPEVPEGAPENVTEESLLKELEDRDPYEKRLKPITQDKHVPVAEKATQSAWVVKHCGDRNIYQHHADPNTQVNYGVVVVRSLQWPGSYTFYTQGRYLQIYVGNGHKYETQSYYPVHPPKIMDDPDAFDEIYQQQQEPTPLYEEVVPQDDVDGGNNGDDDDLDDQNLD